MLCKLLVILTAASVAAWRVLSAPVVKAKVGYWALLPVLLWAIFFVVVMALYVGLYDPKSEEFYDLGLGIIGFMAVLILAVWVAAVRVVLAIPSFLKRDHSDRQP